MVIGYSGGGSRATWLANLPAKPKIDLMVLYDPSPTWQMKAIYANVKKATMLPQQSRLSFLDWAAAL
jgi:hypothetical protein